MEFLQYVSNGVSLASLSSAFHILGEPLRKNISQLMDPMDHLAMRGLIQAPVLCLMMYLEGSPLQINQSFLFSLFVSGTINLVSNYFYHRSLQLAPLSSTVPMLFFTPASLLVVSFQVLGEIPSFMGLVGVLFISFGGFWMHRSANEGDQSRKHRQGVLYMLLVAVLWSISCSFDKLGITNSTPLTYGALAQVLITTFALLSKEFVSEEPAFDLIAPRGVVESAIPWKKLGVSACVNIPDYLLYLIAVKKLKISYVIAIKRAGCLLSLLTGELSWKELGIQKKIVPILMIVTGFFLIILTN